MKNDEFDLMFLHNNQIVRVKENADYDIMLNMFDDAMDKVHPRKNVQDLVQRLDLDSTEEAEKELQKRVLVIGFSTDTPKDGHRIMPVLVSQEAFKQEPDKIKNKLRHVFQNPSLVQLII